MPRDGWHQCDGFRMAVTRPQSSGSSSDEMRLPPPARLRLLRLLLLLLLLPLLLWLPAASAASSGSTAHPSVLGEIQELADGLLADWHTRSVCVRTQYQRYSNPGPAFLRLARGRPQEA